MQNCANGKTTWFQYARLTHKRNVMYTIFSFNNIQYIFSSIQHIFGIPSKNSSGIFHFDIGRLQRKCLNLRFIWLIQWGVDWSVIKNRMKMDFLTIWLCFLNQILNSNYDNKKGPPTNGEFPQNVWISNKKVWSYTTSELKR